MYSPTTAAAAQQQRGKAASQAWRAVVGWIGFFLQVLLQILRGTPSCAQLLSFVGFRYPLLSGPAASEPLPEVAFMPLHSEIPADAAPAPKPASEPLGRLTVRRFGFLFVSVEPLMSGVGGNGAFVKYMGFNQIYGFQSNSVVDLGRWKLHVDQIGGSIDIWGWLGLGAVADVRLIEVWWLSSGSSVDCLL